MLKPLFATCFAAVLTAGALAQTEADAPLQFVEEMPVWHTCTSESSSDAAMNCTNARIAQYIAEHVTYTRKMRKRGVSGTVIARFIVERDGSISGVEIVRGVAPDLDEQVVDAVASMPVFQPGTQRGKTVRVQFALPVKFSL